MYKAFDEDQPQTLADDGTQRLAREAAVRKSGLH